MEIGLAIIGVLIAGAALLFGDGLLRRNRAERHARTIEALRLRPGEEIELDEVDPGFITLMVAVFICIAAVVIVAIIYNSGDKEAPIVAPVQNEATR